MRTFRNTGRKLGSYVVVKFSSADQLPGQPIHRELNGVERLPRKALRVANEMTALA